jgi:hypothetical protein
MSKNFNFVHLIFVIRKKLTPMLKIAEQSVWTFAKQCLTATGSHLMLGIDFVD